MRLKAPPFTTQVQSPTAVYPLDAEGCISVPEGHSDALLFTGLGFQHVADLAVPTRDLDLEPTTEPAAVAQDPNEGDLA